MTWDNRIISQSELARYAIDGDRSLASQVKALLAHQRERWPLLAEGYDAYHQMQTKPIKVDEAEVVVQHNPRRIRSTAAIVDRKSIAERACFLCPDNLPPEEKGIAYEDMVILCNPYPVLDRHLSIVHREHIEQKIDGNGRLILALARDLGSEFFVLYNGPECGASAPDHFHLQACSSALLPIAEHLFDNEPALSEECPSCEDAAANSFELFTLGGCARTVVVIRGGDPSEVDEWIARVVAELGRHFGKREPMINVVCTYSNRIWTVYVFPRAKHRPASFFAEGEQQLIVSPGAIDMAGVVVVPQREHFDRLDGERLAAIYREVSVNEDTVNQMLDFLTSAEETFWNE